MFQAYGLSRSCSNDWINNIGLLALSVILYCISGRLSPVFQKL
ncbi:hypothetical protein C4J89_2726 [Pseudomonas sp. R4-35-07]|nr:hypothetical protein [Pseudomonas sp. R4-35-07]AZF32201.1 hypothetical protein C4J89_2726 [Pseudomonas sp. R4-35-07]